MNSNFSVRCPVALTATILDLFCGAGGAAYGYQQAGFSVTGIDHEPQPNYVGDAFYLCDAFWFAERYGAEFDAVHASPPYQSYGKFKHLARPQPKLVADVRKCLLKLQRPYIIENVVGAPLFSPLILCGTQFGLKVFRHRLFETSFPVPALPHAPHTERIGRNGFVSVVGHGSSGAGTPKDHRTLAAWQTAMQIDWMTRQEMTQAVPPAYTEYIGRYLREYLHERQTEKSRLAPLWGQAQRQKRVLPKPAGQGRAALPLSWRCGPVWPCQRCL